MSQQNPFAAPTGASPNVAGTAAASQQRLAWTPLLWFCVGYYALAILWGVHSVVASEWSLNALLIPLMLALCLGLWAVADARQRNHAIPLTLHYLFFVLAWFLVPAYVIYTRGWRGIGWVLLHAILWYVVATIAMIITGLFYYGVGWLLVPVDAA